MQQDYITLLIDIIMLIQEPSIEKSVKEKAIKSLLKQSVDISPNYGSQTKRDLKQLIDMPINEKKLFDTIFTYLNTHNVLN